MSRWLSDAIKKELIFLEITSEKVQAPLVIRDLTLRVFAITRFREKKSREKIVQ